MVELTRSSAAGTLIFVLTRYQKSRLGEPIGI